MSYLLSTVERARKATVNKKEKVSAFMELTQICIQLFMFLLFFYHSGYHQLKMETVKNLEPLFLNGVKVCKGYANIICVMKICFQTNF